jgi:hypothetical protein
MANTNAGRKLYIATTTVTGPPSVTTPTAFPDVLNLTAFEAITEWTEVKDVGSIGQTGVDTNIVSYDTLATEVTQKQKGISNAGDPEIECARNPTDAGQLAMRAAAATRYNYAFKIEDADAPQAGWSNTIYYNRGVVSGPFRPNGRNEDFILETFRLGLNQKEIVADPEDLS